MDMEESTETQSPPPLESGGNKTGLSAAAKVGIFAGIIVGLAVLVLVLIFLLDRPETTETIRDLFIIVLALETLVIGTLLAILIYQLIVLMRILQNDLKPMLESTQETLNTVKGTARFVSERVTKPAIAASGYVSGVGRSASVLIGMLPRPGRLARPQIQAKEAQIRPAETEEGDEGNEQQ